MNIFTIFCHQILAKYSPKRIKLHHFLGGAYPQTPLINAWLRHALHGAPRHANTFYKHILNPPEMKS